MSISPPPVNSRTPKARVKRAGPSSLSPSSRPTTPPMPAVTAGPSSPPRRNPPPAKSPHKSPARSFSLSGKPRTTFTGQIIVPSLPASELVRPPYDTAPNSTIRRSASDESIQVRSGRSSSEPPAPPPKEPLLLASDSLFQAARLKLSSKDQEAMRKIRSTMNSDSNDTQSHGNPSPLSPLFPNYASGSGSVGRMRPRGSTLSKQVFAMNHEAEAGPSVPRVPYSDNQVDSRHPSKEDADHVIAVLGHAGTGKSTVIRRALRAWGASNPILFQTPQGHPVSSCYSTIQPAGKLKHAWRVEFLEIDIGALSLAEGSTSIFPEGIPNISGAVVCYDATQERSLSGIREILQRLTSESLPCVLLACKSDPDVELEVKPTQGDALAKPFNVGLIEVTNMTPDGKSRMRNALRWLMFKLEQRHRRIQRKSTAPLKTTPPVTRVTSPDSDTSSGAEKFMWSQTIRPETESDTHSSSSSLQWMMKGPLSATLVAEVESEDRGYEKSGATDSKAEGEQVEEVLPPTLWFSEAELTNRVFTGIVSAQDEQFVTAFTLTFRRFMTPAHLMALFYDRFREIQQHAIASDIKHWALQRVAGALIDWCKKYPGDLAESATQESFKQILDLVLPHLFMAHLTAELAVIAQNLQEVEDLDQSWSLIQPEPLLNDLPVPLSAASDLVLDPKVLYDFESSIDKSESETLPTTTDRSLTPSLRTKSSTSLPVEENYRQRENMPKSRVDLNRLNSSEEFGFGKWTLAANHVLNGDPGVFAVELTKAQWTLFTAIRPRDIFRHDFGAEKETPVNKSITFFNHVSRWTSTLILAHSKAKYRAKIYDRFMLITHQLRRLNNYDGLYAIISGMQETSVHRLTQTHALVYPSPTTREFQNHLKLMDPRGGYGSYRRAIEADLTQGKSAIPLLTTILGMVSRLQSTRPEDIRQSDQYIQWDKFERFHEILSIIPQCQQRGLAIAGKVSPGFRKIIDDTPVISSEDALFERSRLLEPIGGGGSRAANAFKRFVNNVDNSMRITPGPQT